jgi:hypothetical protein
MRRDSLAWNIFIHQHLIEWTIANPIREQALPKPVRPLGDGPQRRGFFAVRFPVRLAPSLPCCVPWFSVNCLHQVAFLFGIDVIRYVR